MAFSVDDAWDNGPEVTRAGTAAFGLYCRCGAWCARNLTDGFVPSEIAAAYGTPEWARKLVDAGLWEIVEGGYRDPHYLKRNESRDQVLRRRRADAERKRKWRERSRRDSEKSPKGSPTRSPRSLLPTPKGVKGAPASRGGARPPDSRSVAEALARDGCEHGNPDSTTCALCRRGIPAEEVS